MGIVLGAKEVRLDNLQMRVAVGVPRLWRLAISRWVIQEEATGRQRYLGRGRLGRR